MNDVIFAACNLISSGVAAIFGPNDPMIGAHIQSLSDSLDIPHIESRLDLEPDVKDCSVNLHPDPHITGKSIRDLVDYLNWTRIAVLYQDDICETTIKVIFLFLVSLVKNVPRSFCSLQ